VLLARRGAYAEALPQLRQALEAEPANALYWIDYASTFVLAGQPDEAHHIVQMARRHGMQGEEFDGLEERIKPRYALHPDFVALRQAFAQAEAAGNYADVEAQVRADIERFGPRPRLLQFLGTVLLRQQRNTEACAAFEQALKGEVPDRLNLYNQYGIILNRLGRYREAETAYQQALALDAEQPGVWVNLADNYNDQKRYAEALPWLEKALQTAPSLREARVNLAIAYRGLGRDREALSQLDQLLGEGYATDSVHALRAAALLALQRPAEASVALRSLDLTALPQQRPDLTMPAVSTLLTIGEHATAHALLNGLLQQAESLPTLIPSAMFTAAYLDSRLAKPALSVQYGQAVSAGIEPFTRWASAENPARLRIGVVSADLKLHPVAQFLEGILQASQGRNIDWLAYSNLSPAKEDALTARLKPLFADWRTVDTLSDEALAQQIHDDRIDILIDLSGYTDGHRLPVFARRPAPLQISWLGYFATTGLPTIDYVLADETSVPKARRSDFTEQVVWLPHSRLCFTPPPDAPPVAPLPALANGHVTFGSFQRLEKITDSQLRLWGQVLNAVPNARLRLQAKGLNDSAFVASVQQRLADCGIAPEQVDYHGPGHWHDYLTAYADVDIVLDTFPYPGGTTTCEALWMGVPTVTLAGATMLERQGASLLKAAGLGRWIANTPAEFVKRAQTLAMDLPALARLRAGLRQQVAKSPLCDAKAFVRALEATLRKCWQKTAVPRLKEARAHAGETALSLEQANQLLKQAIQYYEAGEASRARPLTERLIAQFPQQGVLWKVHGAVLTALGEREAALQAKRRAVELAPNDADALANLGNSLQEADEVDEAETVLRQALAVEPNHLNGLNNLGMVLYRLFRFKEAQETLEQALALNPDFPAALINYGNVLRDQNKIDEAEAAYQKAIALAPYTVIAHMNLGVLYSERKPKRPMEAEAALKRALELDADHVETLVKLGELYRELKRFKPAEDCFAKATERNPHHPQAWVGLAGVKAFAHGNLDEAIPCLERALAQDPDLLYVRSSLLFNHGYTDQVSPEEHLKHARLFGEGIARKATPFTDWQPPAAPPLRVGLIGGDFRAHPVGYFIENILKYLDASQIELFIYSNNPYDDAISEALAGLIPNWRNVYGVSVKKVVDYIRDENLHILIDLAGHTGYNRLDVFPYRPAPVQVTWLGYPSTTGVAAMDWLIADPTGVPEANRWHFTEKVWYVPHTRLCFTPPRTELEVTPLPALQNGYVSFGCVQNLTKVTDAALALWRQILDRVPGAQLRVQAPQFSDMKARDDFRARLAKKGIDARRAVLLKPSPREEYLSLLRESDFLLDSFPYPGGTTTCEALWMGVPTLTLAGNTLLARQGASLMTAGGLPDWVVDTPAAYVEKAVAFASDLPALVMLRAGLREKVAASPLFDGQLFARHFEQALYGMWDQYNLKG
jgi:predicted O-linked N-acetylglucosamine transferase (SPINDLY family)